MEYILNNIGQNKVNIHINHNEFEETHKINYTANLFNNIDNIIDVYKQIPVNVSNKPTLKQKLEKTKSEVVEVNQKSKPAEVTLQVKPEVTRTFKSKDKDSKDKEQVQAQEIEAKDKLYNLDGILLCILEYIDPTVSLLSMSGKLEKINKFKNQIILDLKDPSYKKRTIFKNEDILKYITDNYDEKICFYLAKLINKNIIIKCVSVNIIDYNVYMYDNIEDCIIITRESANEYMIYNFDGIDKINIVKEMVLKERVKNFMNQDIFSKIDAMLVKDLKDIAEELYIETSYRDGDNKKKSYLKNELKDIILKKFDLYK